jgi:hypothetical protein
MSYKGAAMKAFSRTCLSLLKGNCLWGQPDGLPFFQNKENFSEENALL